jgi:hypothetical protein
MPSPSRRLARGLYLSRIASRVASLQVRAAKLPQCKSVHLRSVLGWPLVSVGGQRATVTMQPGDIAQCLGVCPMYAPRLPGSASHAPLASSAQHKHDPDPCLSSLRNEKVRGSNPRSSTTREPRPTSANAETRAGFRHCRLPFLRLRAPPVPPGREFSRSKPAESAPVPRTWRYRFVVAMDSWPIHAGTLFPGQHPAPTTGRQRCAEGRECGGRARWLPTSSTEGRTINARWRLAKWSAGGLPAAFPPRARGRSEVRG